MDYRSRFLSNSLARFTQPDTIIPNPANPQTLNRYSYTLNNPIKYTDPSGHKAEEDIGSGCDTTENECVPVDASAYYEYQLEQFVETEIFKTRKDGKLVLRNTHDDLEAMAAIVDYVTKLYNPYGVSSQDVWTAGMLENLSNIFLGVRSQGIGTLASARNYETRYKFGASGFHPDYFDESNQPRHVWGFIAETATAPGGGNASSAFLAQGANWQHEVLGNDAPGRSFNDYVLSEAGISIGERITFGQISPSQLGNGLRSELGVNGGSGGRLQSMVNDPNPPWWYSRMNYYQP